MLGDILICSGAGKAASVNVVGQFLGKLIRSIKFRQHQPSWNNRSESLSKTHVGIFLNRFSFLHAMPGDGVHASLKYIKMNQFQEWSIWRNVELFNSISADNDRHLEVRGVLENHIGKEYRISLDDDDEKWEAFCSDLVADIFNEIGFPFKSMNYGKGSTKYIFPLDIHEEISKSSKWVNVTAEHEELLREDKLNPYASLSVGSLSLSPLKLVALKHATDCYNNLALGVVDRFDGLDSEAFDPYYNMYREANPFGGVRHGNSEFDQYREMKRESRIYQEPIAEIIQDAEVAKLLKDYKLQLESLFYEGLPKSEWKVGLLDEQIEILDALNHGWRDIIMQLGKS
ncbi:hypothetical protein [Undibacterium aquatile]|uniref:Uncharacterized protein n=1 Tax=Undibacterium aquatile TaxID=1537398 RepID=A0ABR6XAZ0_9BURK|nr:hypothetical protein [Undibacterium aquatile]MBC3810095.1 hypothetical protein [Undibacterium aquatile]